MTIINMGVNGAGGRMGCEIATAIQNEPSARLAVAIEYKESPLVGSDMGTLIGASPSGVLIETDLLASADKADVLIDFSLPQATASVIDGAVKSNTPLICGTTGVDDATQALFDKAAQTIPVLYASNLSQGIAVMSSLVEQAARILNEEYDIEVVEMHHRNKVDAPSGTALTLAEFAAKGRGLNPKEALKMGRSGHTGVRPEGEIGMHAVRGGGVFGDHTVILASANERIEITHRAASRGLFAKGAVKAALFLANKPAGRYTMKDVLGL